MNREMIDRLREAKKYELMAMKALFPDSQSEHIEVMKNEIKEMVVEFVFEFFAQKSSEEEKCSDNKKQEKESNVKKVKIG
ncbi:hypothetical protein SAMN05661086_00395 [Anaeromicropila populeti]|uniref:Uncharacterized protein n=2 Tax=Anaeromicropila populeti TaxID=37658 RepID=A0A1I6HY56_9FIRM|nr:hypothetical protein SAMN05661086_00395 [Anaeromicropila populeti]